MFVGSLYCVSATLFLEFGADIAAACNAKQVQETVSRCVLRAANAKHMQQAHA